MRALGTSLVVLGVALFGLISFAIVYSAEFAGLGLIDVLRRANFWRLGVLLSIPLTCTAAGAWLIARRRRSQAPLSS